MVAVPPPVTIHLPSRPLPHLREMTPLLSQRRLLLLQRPPVMIHSRSPRLLRLLLQVGLIRLQSPPHLPLLRHLPLLPQRPIHSRSLRRLHQLPRLHQPPHLLPALQFHRPLLLQLR